MPAAPLLDDPRFHCPRCAASVPVRAPRLSDRLLFALVVTITLAICAGAPLLGFVMFLLSPVLLFMGMGIGPAAAAAFAPVTCARCGCCVEPARPEHATAAVPVVSPAAVPVLSPAAARASAPAAVTASVTRAAA